MKRNQLGITTGEYLAMWTIGIALLALILALSGCGGGSGSISPDKPINNAVAQSVVAPGTGIHAAGEIINTGPMPCDRQIHTATWNAGPTGAKVVMARQWVGFDYSLESDTDVTTYIVDASGNILSTLNRQQLDNYKHRSFEQERWVSYLPAYMDIPPNGGLRVVGLCNQIFGGTNFHITVSVWLV